MRCLLIFTLLLASPTFALENVTMQLRWLHQFQFAGYYAALEKGFYKDAGLDVTLKEGGPNVSAIDEVLQGRAQFGVSTSGLVNAYMNGKPVLMLAPIIQHSPLVLLSLGKKLANPAAVAKAGVISLQPGDESLELKTIFANDGITLGKLQITTESRGLDDLLAGKIVAMNAYLSNEPFYLQKRGIPYSLLEPEHYGMDFYSDVLFTSRGLEKAKPDIVAAFRAATLKGWKYAIEHQDETIDLILARYNTQGKSREHLAFEAKTLAGLISPELIQIGYSNPGRWKHISEVYAKIGMEKSGLDLEGFFYDPNPPLDLTWFYRGIFIALLLIVSIGMVALYIFRTNRRLQNSLLELRSTQQALAQSEQHYRLLVENMRDVVWILDPVTMRFRFASPSVEQFRGFTVEEMLDMPLDKTVPPDVADALKLKIQDHMAEFLSGLYPDKAYVEEFPMLRKDGSAVWGEVIAKYYRNSETGQVEIHGVTRDISQRKEAEAEIKRLATHDLLTGLPNRMLLNDRLQQALAVAKREHGRGALMFLDLDKFKQINDTLGHDVGDQLLKQAAARMRECARDSDTVARIGGDEFIVLLRTVEEVQDAIRVAEKIRVALCSPFDLAKQWLTISCSIGIALYPEHGNNAVDLFKNADIAMYQAKEHGRDNVRVFAPSVH